MRRIRLLRILLPLLFLGFLVTIVLTVRTRPQRGVRPTPPSADDGARMEGFRFSDLVGGRRRLLVEARVGRVDSQGAFEVDDVRRAELDRAGQPPLVLSAPRGQGSGPQGRRVMRLEGGVTLRDEETGLTLEIPTVEVDQVSGVVRSLGEVRLSGERWSGSASAVVHSLTGQPAQLLTLRLDGRDGEHLEAHSATFEPGASTLTLEGKVVARQGGVEILSERVILVRNGASGRLERAQAGPGVSGSSTGSDRGAGQFVAHEAVVTWRDDGTLAGFVLSGAARLEHVQGTLMADRVEVMTEAGGDRRIAATGSVVVSGLLKRGPGRLSCDMLRGTLALGGDVRDGTATGNVRFNGEGTAGEAAEARFTILGQEGSITLLSDPLQRARVANGRTRVAADTIVSDLRGRRFEARGRAESTLLPDASKRRKTPMFAGGEAIHFVSSSLVSDANGSVLTFRGDVRGWQGERSLAASVVEMRQEGESLDAEGGVATRIPRESGTVLREGDYIQVTADRLAYRGATKTAAYDGDVRVRQAEGWLETPHIDAAFGDRGEGIRTATATGGVRFEYRSRGASGALTTATGQGDRAVFEAAGRAIRVFGESGPATVVASGEKAGTTAGRVLRYELETGALEVESGDRDRATIKTPTE